MSPLDGYVPPGARVTLLVDAGHVAKGTRGLVDRVLPDGRLEVLPDGGDAPVVVEPDEVEQEARWKL